MSDEKIKKSRPDMALARTLYSDKGWNALYEELKDNEADGEFGAYKTLCVFHMAYERYLEDAAELAKRTIPRSITESIIVKDRFGPDKLHKDFYELVEDCADELQSILRRDIDPGRADEFAGSIISTLLKAKWPEDPIYWPLVACEHHAVPLIEFLSLDSVLRIYAEYDDINPNNQSLPNQLRVKQALKGQILNKGGAIPRKKRFWQK